MIITSCVKLVSLPFVALVPAHISVAREGPHRQPPPWPFMPSSPLALHAIVLQQEIRPRPILKQSAPFECMGLRCSGGEGTARSAFGAYLLGTTMVVGTLFAVFTAAFKLLGGTFNPES